MREHILIMLAKTMDFYVFHFIAQCAITTTSFDLWMLGFDTFVVVINFINEK